MHIARICVQQFPDYCTLSLIWIERLIPNRIFIDFHAASPPFKTPMWLCNKRWRRLWSWRGLSSSGGEYFLPRNRKVFILTPWQDWFACNLLMVVTEWIIWRSDVQTNFTYLAVILSSIEINFWRGIFSEQGLMTRKYSCIRAFSFSRIVWTDVKERSIPQYFLSNGF